jgi:CBS domain-containing protein
MINVGQLLDEKGHQVWHISPEDTVFDAIALMDGKGVGALAVIEGEHLIGIVSERDYARKVILKNRTSKETKVGDIMTSQVFHTFPEQPVGECLVVMNKYRVRHLPVMQEGRLMGMISMGDVVKEIIKVQKYTIEQLERHVAWAEAY